MRDFFPFFCRQLREYFTGPQKMHFSKRYPTRLEKCIFIGKSALFLVHFSPSDNAPEEVWVQLKDILEADYRRQLHFQLLQAMEFSSWLVSKKLRLFLKLSF